MASKTKTSAKRTPRAGEARPFAWATPARLAIAAAAAVPLVVFAPILGHGFLLDDFVLFRTSPSLADLGSIGRGFRLDVGAVRKGAETVISSYYRPVFLALSTLYYQIAGGDPAAWHLASLALASALGALACALLLRLGIAPRLAFLAAVVFSLHPSHVSSVAWASGLQELLAATFTLGAALALLHRAAPGREHAAVPLALGAAAFALALLSKEVAIGLVPLVAIAALASRRADPALARRLGAATGVLGAVAVLYLAARIAALGGLAHPPVNAPGFATALPSIPVALFTYVRLLVWPVGFAILRPERPTAAPIDPSVLAALAGIAALVALVAIAARREPRTLAPTAWFVVWLVPALNVWALDPQWMVTDRYLFLPSLALPWLIALLVPPRRAAGGLAVLAVIFAVLSLRYEAIFASERSFVDAMAAAEPTSPLVFAEKGRLLLADGDPRGAEDALRRAVELDSTAPGALIALGDLELGRGDLDDAERHYRGSLVARPYASRGLKLVAVARSRAGEADRAFALVEECARRWPDDFEIALLQALLHGARGDRDGAETAFSRARTLRPADPAVAAGLDAAIARILPTLQPRRRSDARR